MNWLVPTAVPAPVMPIRVRFLAADGDTDDSDDPPVLKPDVPTRVVSCTWCGKNKSIPIYARRRDVNFCDSDCRNAMKNKRKRDETAARRAARNTAA